MNKEELEQNSRLIIKFMGWKTNGNVEIMTPFYQNYMSVGAGMCQTHIFHINETKFHSSWDWLMAVISNIAKNGMYYLTFDDDKASFYKLYRVKIACTTTGNLKGAYKAVIEFIKWYNEHKD